MAATAQNRSEVFCFSQETSTQSVSRLYAVVREAGFRIEAVDTLRAAEKQIAGDAKIMVLCRDRAGGPVPGRAEGKQKTRIVGESEHIAGVREHLASIAQYDVTTLITGPTGCGKEVVALELHDRSPRRSGPLVALNCAAIPDELLEGELFGYEKGAFTGATRSYPGKLKLADEGTLFLDEIGELSPVGQAKLLRAIDTGSVYRLGARDPTSFNVRIIAATNRDLAREVREGRFRIDLFYRLAVARVELWSLSRRQADILPLARHFALQTERTHALGPLRLAPDAERAMLAYSWPGNARELRNCIELAGLSACDGLIRARHLAPHVLGEDHPSTQTTETESPIALSSDAEVERIRHALSLCDGNKSGAARHLGWSRMTLYRKIARYGLSQPM